MPSSELLTVDQVAEYLNIKASTLYSKLSEIPHYKIGKLIRFKKDEIDLWLEGTRVAPVDPGRAAKEIFRRATAGSNLNIERIIRKSIDRVKTREYNLSHGKPDQVKGLGKEVHDGSL